jgi:hypothetical protein
MKAYMVHQGWSAWRTLAALFVSAAIMAGCSQSPSAGVGTGGTGSFDGIAALDVTDAPAIDYAHVFVTVTRVAFHTDASATFSSYSASKAGGWQIVKLPTPRTIDLAQLTNGTMYADHNGNSSLFSGMTLPAGSYQQIRIFLASTEDAYVGSVPGLVYNNEVQLNGDTAHYPLRIPTSDEGIKVVPEAPIVVAGGGSVSLALDFNLNDDVVKVAPNGTTEFILKPRLGYFDMGSVGAVTGTVSFPNLSTSRIEVKAEQVKSGANYRIVRRTTSVDRTTGTFSLYPLPVFGNATTAVYDILLRGRDVETAIVRGVTVHKGTTIANGATDLGTITMQAGTEFTAQLGSALHPTGAWLDFYQAIAGDPAPYEVRYRHLDPYTGKLPAAMELSTGTIHVASFIPGSPLVFASDTTSQGRFSLVADATDLYDRGAALSGISGARGKSVSITMAAANGPQMIAGATTGNIACAFDMALLGTGMGPGMGMGNRGIGYPSKGQIFATHGGMIVDSIGDQTGDTTVNAAMYAGGGAGNSVVLANLPSNVAGAVYGIYVLGWGNGYIVAGKALDIDMRKGGTATSTIRIE